MEFHLLRPQWLLTLVPAVALLALLWRQRKRSGSWQAVIAPQLLHHLVSGPMAARASNLLPLVFLGWLLAALAASGPSWQKIPQPVQQKQDALVILLDLSYSMKSADLQPSRLDRARQKLLDLLRQRREGQTGLIAYAGDAHIVTPLTDDTPTIANLLPALGPDMMPLPGSEPVSAVTQALELLRSAGIRDGRILLVTDGVSDKDREGIRKVLAGSNAKLSVMGVGTETGAPIPLPRGGFLKDEKGAIVMPGLDEQGLRELADATGGSYQRMQLDDSDLQPLLQSSLDSLQQPGATNDTLVTGRTADTWEDQGYLLVLALLPLALGLFRRGWLVTLLPLLLLAQPDSARASTWDDLWLTPDQQGQRALQQGDNAKAATLFKDSDWAGTAAYQNGDYETAINRFNQPENADSLYNRGNALAHTGKLDEAIASYEKSLELKPGQADAEANLETLKKLKEQQQKQQQQQNQQQDNKQQQDKDKQQGQGQDRQQDQNEQQGQDQQQGQNQPKDQDQQQAQNQQHDQNQQQGQDQQQARNEQQAQKQQQGQKQQQSQQQDQQQKDQQQAQDGTDKQQDAASDKQRAQAQPANKDDAAKEESGKEQAAQAAQQTHGTEQDQAMEQWLRRVPDDPSGLLRQKFRYESRLRQQQGVGSNDEKYW